ncbi:MAG: hypothetical protein WA003_00510 [Desulfuromonadaceae bacterium]
MMKNGGNPVRCFYGNVCLRAVLLLVCTVSFFFVNPVRAIAAAGYADFQRVMMLPIDKQVDQAVAILKSKYETRPEAASYEHYMGYTIPFFVMTNEASFAAYRIAALKPGLLARYEVYDDCGGEQPINLLACFFKDGMPGTFIDLGASCSSCYAETVSVFLWDEMGASSGQIVGGLRFLYDPSLREGTPMTP